MRNIVAVVTAALLLGAAAANAADLPVKAPPAPLVPVYNWSGFYVGLNGGWANSHQQWTGTPGGVTTGDFTGNGGLFGGTAGWNWQSGRIVLGLEGDFDWSRIRAGDATTGGCALAFPCTATVTNLGTVRGRVGWTFDRFLAYVTGGAAFAGIHNEQIALSPLADTTTEKAGWVFGGGIEAMILPKWSVKAEYLRAQFGQTAFCPAAGCVATVVSDYTRLNVFRVGINYHFDWGPVVARY
jgi:outer membrane immunogenic protein